MEGRPSLLGFVLSILFVIAIVFCVVFVLFQGGWLAKIGVICNSFACFFVCLELYEGYKARKELWRWG